MSAPPSAPPLPGNETTLGLQDASSVVGNGTHTVPYNTRQVFPYEPSADSATIDVYTGIMDTGKLTKLRERAVYDLNTLSYAPLADAGTGIIFPDAVKAKVEVESSLRVRPTHFRGRQQLDVAEEKGEVHINRQMHPNGTNVSDQTWYKQKDDLPFVGFPNPDLFYSYMEAIPTQNVQNLSHAQLTDALRASGGAFDHNDYLKHVGALMKGGNISEPAHASIEHVVQTDGGGVNSDPRLLERIAEEYEKDFQKAARMRVSMATQDPRFAQSAPGIAYMKESQDRIEQRETQWSKVSNMWGIGSTYTNPEVLRTG